MATDTDRLITSWPEEFDTPEQFDLAATSRGATCFVRPKYGLVHWIDSRLL